jgi:hypothetical protein
LFSDKRVEEQMQTGVPDNICVVPGDDTASTPTAAVDNTPSTVPLSTDVPRDTPAADDAKVTPSTPGDKTDKRPGKSKKKQKRKKGTETGVERKEPDVPAAAAHVPIPDSKVRPDNGDNEGAITDTPVVTGAGDMPAEPESAINVEDRPRSPADARSTDEPDASVQATSTDGTIPMTSTDDAVPVTSVESGVCVTCSDEDIPVSAVEDGVVPATEKTTSTLVTNEEIPVEPELADTDKMPAQPEHTSTGLVTERDEEIPSGPEKVDTSDDRKSDDSSPVGSVAEQDDTPVAPERNSRLFTETKNTLVTGNDNKVMISCKHIVVVMFDV